MIGAGTGAAPSRGSIQERAPRSVHGEVTGTGLLFFGCDHPGVDFPSPLGAGRMGTGWHREVYPAFCRKPDGEVMFSSTVVARMRACPCLA